MLQKNHAWGSQEKWDTNGTAKKTVLLLLLSSSRNNGSKKNRAQKGAAFLHNEKSKVASEGLQRWRSGPPCRCEWKTHTLPTTFPFKQRETLCKNCTHIRRTLRTFNLLTVPLASMHQNKIVISKTQPARTQVKAAVWNEMRGSLSPAFWRESEIRPPPPSGPSLGSHILELWAMRGSFPTEVWELFSKASSVISRPSCAQQNFLEVAWTGWTF